MFTQIETNKDIEYFLDKTNGLHDGYLVGVHYVNNGVSVWKNGYEFNPRNTKLTLRILVTSLEDILVEIEFETLLRWQIKDDLHVVLDTSVVLDDSKHIVWSSDTYTNLHELSNTSYVIAKSMRWRIVD